MIKIMYILYYHIFSYAKNIRKMYAFFVTGFEVTSRVFESQEDLSKLFEPSNFFHKYK